MFRLKSVLVNDVIRLRTRMTALLIRGISNVINFKVISFFEFHRIFNYACIFFLRSRFDVIYLIETSCA